MREARHAGSRAWILRYGGWYGCWSQQDLVHRTKMLSIAIFALFVISVGGQIAPAPAPITLYQRPINADCAQQVRGATVNFFPNQLIISGNTSNAQNTTTVSLISVEDLFRPDVLQSRFDSIQSAKSYPWTLYEGSSSSHMLYMSVCSILKIFSMRWHQCDELWT